MTNLALLSVEAFTVSTESLNHEDVNSAFDDITLAADLTERLQDTFEQLKSKTAIGRDTAAELKELSAGFVSLESHFARIPLLSYTKAPSKTNLAITQESLLGSIGEAILKAIAVVIKLIREVIGYVLNAILGRKESLAKVDDLVIKAVALLDYQRTWQDVSPVAAQEVDQLLESVLNKHVGIMGKRWNALLQNGLTQPNLYRRSYETLSLSLQAVGPQFVASVTTFVSDLRSAKQPNDVVTACKRLDASLTTGPLLEQLANEFGYKQANTLPDGMTSFQALAQYVQSVIKSMSNNWSPKLDTVALKTALTQVSTIDPWVGMDGDTAKVMRQVQQAMDSLKALDQTQVAPGLAEVFEMNVPREVKFLTSMAKGFRLVEDSMGQFAEVHRELVVGRVRCLIDEVKVLDKKLSETKSDWSMQARQSVEQKKRRIGSTWNV